MFHYRNHSLVATPESQTPSYIHDQQQFCLFKHGTLAPQIRHIHTLQILLLTVGSRAFHWCPKWQLPQPKQGWLSQRRHGWACRGLGTKWGPKAAGKTKNPWATEWEIQELEIISEHGIYIGTKALLIYNLESTASIVVTRSVEIFICSI